MGGIDWGALDFVCAWLDVADVELFVQQLVSLRDCEK